MSTKYMADFGEMVVRSHIAKETKTVRYHPLSKQIKTVSYDFFIPEWNCLGEVKTKYNARKSGFSISKKRLAKYKKYSDIWGYDYLFYFVDINARAIYMVTYKDFKNIGEGVHNPNMSSVKYYPTALEAIGHISIEDYKTFTLNHTKDTVKSYEF